MPTECLLMDDAEVEAEAEDRRLLRRRALATAEAAADGMPLLVATKDDDDME